MVQDYGFRLYNPSIGKFLSVDPLAKSYPYYTPYQFAGNMPVWAIDLDGLEEWKTNNGPIEGPYRDQFEAEDAAQEESLSSNGSANPTTEEVAYNTIKEISVSEPMDNSLETLERGEIMFANLEGLKKGGLDYANAYYEAQIVYLPSLIKSGYKVFSQGFNKLGKKMNVQIGEVLPDAGFSRIKGVIDEGYLPGKQGTPLLGTMTESQARVLMKEHPNNEFALMYQYNPITKKGNHYLYSGSIDRMDLPAGENWYLLWHTHPKGTAKPSYLDIDYLKYNVNQKNSIIFPKNKPKVKWNKNSDFIPKP